MVLLLGGTSQLGYSIILRYGPGAITPFCSEHSRYEKCEKWPRVNLDDADGLRRILRERQPKLLLHCAGICDVGKCETRPDFARSINVKSMETLLGALPSSTRLVYCSSDHVFGGERGPYRESDATHPISVYGETRVAAEKLILQDRPDALIIRYGLGIGPSISGRTGHLDWLRYRTKHRLPTTVISDEVRSVVWAEELAERVWSLAHSDVSGIRHMVAKPATSRVDLARHLDRRFDIGSTLEVETRHEQEYPHIGNVELATEHEGPLAMPLAGVVSTTGPAF